MQRLQQKEDWKNVLSNGTVGNLIEGIAEGEAEIARYLEYLFLEKKWRTARNISSLTQMGDVISYKRGLCRSAIGYVLVTHSDPSGNFRLSNYGSLFYDIDQASDWDNLVQNTSASFVEKNALVPRIANDTYIIPKGTIFTASTGSAFLATETVENRALREPWESIKKDENKYRDFLLAGGWNGIKYIKVPVIQGIQIKVDLGIAKGSRFESFILNSQLVEAGLNSISKEFLNVLITVPNTTEPEEWEMVENIRLAGPYDAVYEIKYLSESEKVMIKFGDGTTGRMLPKYSRVQIEYLESKGEEGNLSERFLISSLQLPDGMVQVDPRTNRQIDFLECTNIAPIMGGKNLDDADNFRLNAPISYLRSYTIATQDSYYEQIMKYSPVSLLRLKIFNTPVIEQNSYGIFDIDYNQHLIPGKEYASVVNDSNKILQELSSVKNALLMTAIKANGEKFESPEEEFIIPIIMTLGDKKSPNDSISFLQPNFIKIRVNAVVGTKETMSAEEIAEYVRPAVLKHYSIFNQDFMEPYYESVLVDEIRTLPFTGYVRLFLEAIANVDTPILLTKLYLGKDIFSGTVTEGELEPLLAFPFKFDRIFGQVKTELGFKNFQVNHNFVIRADIINIDNPNQSRSLFLLDQRHQKYNPPTLFEASTLQINTTTAIPLYQTYTIPGFNYPIYVFDSKDSNFKNIQVRTLQFPLIEKIVTDKYSQQMIDWNYEPFEIRPLLQDNKGENRIFDIDLVPEDNQVSLSFTSDIFGSTCYYKNTSWWDNTSIIFSENYTLPDSDEYAMGYVILPLQLVLGDNMSFLKNQLENSGEKDEMQIEIQKLLKGHFEVKVYAQPLLHNFNALNEYDDIFTDENDILVEKDFIIVK